MQREKLSALMDGETLDSELMSELSRDPELQADWSRYHLIRDTMRGDVEQVVHFDIASRVAQALKEEPVRIAPEAIPESQPKPETWRRSPFWEKARPWANQITQIGMAACVSLAVIVGVQYYGNNDALDTFGNDTSAFNTVPMAGSASNVSLDLRSNGGAMVPAQQHNSVERNSRMKAVLQQYELDRRAYQNAEFNVPPTSTQNTGVTSNQSQN